MSSSAPKVLRSAEFDPKLKFYFIFSGSIVFLVTVIGIPLLPLWWLIAALFWAPRFFASLECILTERTLIVRRGVWFKLEKSIPLDKIQDLSLRDGPLLNYFGISKLSIETAGQSGGGAGQGDAVLTGVMGARDFRDAVLAQRDALTEGRNAGSGDRSAGSGEGLAEAEAIGLLREIRDSLQRMEERQKGTEG